jgi:hypothetical protein
MNCQRFQENLTNYMDRSLPTQEMSEIAQHLYECTNCSSLLDDVRSMLVTCKTLPPVELDVSLLERILLRTSGRPRTRTLRELLTLYVFRPMFTPRFAVGAALVGLTLVFTVNWMLPHASSVSSALSPREIFRQMDRGVQRIYSEGLKAYDKKNELQEQFTFFKNNVFNKLGFIIEQLDVPVEGKQDSGEPGQQQEKAPSDKSSMLLLPA